MELKSILPSAPKSLGSLTVTGITCDSREVKPGSVFVCLNGSKSDGHDFAEKAVAAGAVAVVAERDLGLACQITVPDTHRAYAELCAEWFGRPAEKLKLIGVTGTNGKTSFTYMLKAILEKAGNRVGLIGTIQNMIGDRCIAAHNTTPNAYELNSLFALMVAEGCTYAIMEVSSHALDQRRVYGLTFEAAVFTNLTQDHLDYHGTMENYLAAKKRLFTMAKTAIVNTDDEYAARLCEGLTCPIVTYSTGDETTYSAKSIRYRPDGVDYELVGDTVLQHIRVQIGGRFSVYNSLAAAVAALTCGFPATVIAQAIAELPGVKGRAEVVPGTGDFTVIIDYAHTPDGLKNILSTFRDCEKNRLIVLFGCGGDRDKTKRPLMGNIAVHYADMAIVTSDNPRTEDPQAIIEDILVGVRGTKTPYKVIANRVEAIHYAIAKAQPGDIVVLAGKGHETYQILKEGTVHLDEREVVKEALAERRKGEGYYE